MEYLPDSIGAMTQKGNHVATFDVRSANLAVINSVTKYPSIPTYHALGERGLLTEDPLQFVGTTIMTEKIDGVNARIILLPDGTYLIGSRERLVYARGDLIEHPADGIVATIKPIAERAIDTFRVTASDDHLMVIYGEVYGGKSGAAARQYGRTPSFRIFDAMDLGGIDRMMAVWSPEQISRWRDNGNQPFYEEDQLQLVATRAGVQLTPRLSMDYWRAPKTVEEMYERIRELVPHTFANIDRVEPGRSEGIVIRTSNRGTIAKARVADYMKTLRARQAS